MNESQDPRYRIQFTIDDVVDKIKEIHALEEDERTGALIKMNHDLISPLADLAKVASCVVEKEDEQLLNIHQRAYISNLEALAVSAIYNLAELFSFNNADLAVQENALGFVNNLKRIADFLPVTPRVLELGSISGEDLADIEYMDNSFPLTFYSYNVLFSKDFKRDKYNLGREIKILWSDQHKHNQSNKTVIFFSPAVINIETKVDYFSNVIIPLIHNIYRHAFNPANDVNNRNINNEWLRCYKIMMKADEEKKEIVVEVTDTGFGISQEVLPRLFERGASSKTDKTTDHGIGLWSVKKFIEDNGGRIWVETNLGQGTSFYFTIPYKEKDRVYKQ